MNSRAIIIVKGQVQGVGFRYFTLTEARRINLNGTVSNQLNGDVKVVVEGEKSAIHALIKSLRIGPRFSDVTDVVVHFEKYKGDLKSFVII